MTRARRCRALLVAGALATAVRAAPAQGPPVQGPPVPADRALTGGSLIVLGTGGFNAPMLALRVTAIHDEFVPGDLTAGLYLHNSVEFVDVDFGIGGYVPLDRTGALTITFGPSALVGVTGGGGGVLGVQGKVSFVVPFDVNLGVRLEAGGNLYRPGGYTTQLWFVGAGITTLGIH